MSKSAERILGSPAFKALQLNMMQGLVARCCFLPAPKLDGDTHAARLAQFGEFSAQCAQAAAARPDKGAAYRARLTDGAFQMGRMVSRLMAPTKATPSQIAHLLYANIDIEAYFDLPSHMDVPRCSFCAWYGPEECLFMSAFDQGVLAGLCNDRALTLEFSTRLTEGHGCCKATLLPRKETA